MKKNFAILFLMCSMTVSVMAQDSAAVAAVNKTLIEMYNETQIKKAPDEAEVLAKGEKADYGRALFGIKDNSQLTDGNVTLRYAIGGYDKKKKELVFDLMTSTHPALAITVENKTSEYIYVDLAKSFVKSVDNVIPFYESSNDPSSDETVSQAAKGTSKFKRTINKVSNKMKNIGKSSTYEELAEKYPDRIIMVAPQEKKELYPVMIFEDNLFYASGMNKINFTLKGEIPCIIIGDNGLKQDERVKWNQESSPLIITSAITYDTTPKMSEPKTLSTNFYMKEAIGVKGNVQFVNSHNLDIYFCGSPEDIKLTNPEKTTPIKVNR